MKKHGTKWIDALEGKQPRHDPVETEQSAAEDRVSRYEEEATSIAKELMDHRIPDGIASCVSRDSERLALSVPFKFYSSQAFQELKQWAEEQRLVLMVCWERDLPIDSEDKFAISICPDRENNALRYTSRSKAS